MQGEKLAILTGDYVAQHAQHPYQILATLGYEVNYVSPGKAAGDTVKTVYHWQEPGEQGYREGDGRPLVIGEDFEDVTADRYAGVIIPGARAPEFLSTTEGAVSLLRAFRAEGHPIAAMCHGPLLLAGAQVVDGVRATAHPLVRPWLELAGAEWVPPTPGDKGSRGKSAEHYSGVVTDQRIVTAPLKVEFPPVMREFLRLLEGSDSMTVELAGDNHLLTPPVDA